MSRKVKEPIEPGNPEKSGKSDTEKIAKLTDDLKKYDDVGYSRAQEAELNAIVDELASIGSPAVPELIGMLSDPANWSSSFAAGALGKIGDARAIIPLADVLEDSDLGGSANDALKEFGEVCIPEVIKRVEYRIAHPIRGDGGVDRITAEALNVIGEIRCEGSIKFMNRLLDEYMSELPDEPFDPTKYDWKYVNLDFFHLLDCMVRQQDERAIPHIEKARDVFPSDYVDYKICQIAIGRIKKKRPDEGYLPLEALDIMLPAGAIMNALSGGELGWEDTFDEEYGEYFEEVGGWKRGREDPDDDDWADDSADSEVDVSKRKFDSVYQFKITLKRIRPPIWRRIQVPETYTFQDLHVAIQDVMGWEGCHLHEFVMADPVTGLEMRIGDPSEDFGFHGVLQEQKEMIARYFSMENKSAEYTYDFGDDWEHRVLLEKILPRDEDARYPVCIKGKRACPPEDCGGVWGYEELLEALHDPDSAEDDELLEWLGEGFDPEYFDAKAIYFRKSSR